MKKSMVLIAAIVIILLLMAAGRTATAAQEGFGISTQLMVDESSLKIVHLVVRTVECGSPAWRAGVYAGDRIETINGEDIEGMSLGTYINETAKALQKGSHVVALRLRRGTTRQEIIVAKLIEGPIVEDETCRNSVRV